jgi:hypothetical protein
VCQEINALVYDALAMNEPNERRDLGMDRRIPRRDFLNGVAVAIGSAYAASKVAPLAGGATGVFCESAACCGTPGAAARSRPTIGASQSFDKRL